ncbi:MAG TPA: SgcJ/EcaC family oxidoreductase [Acidimicrobiales bacterium]|nr:SgcJ/EcaC family oxidoreductase [Acidimicrobiales bacterium]
MSHKNEDRLRELYGIFARGDLQGFLDGCTDDVTFHVPGEAAVSGVFTKGDFPSWITGVMGIAGGTFQEHILDVCANDDHGMLELRHEFDRDGVHRSYLTAHVVEFRDGRISRWEERPGSIAEFEAAWGPRSEEGSDALSADIAAFFKIVADSWAANDGDAFGALFTDDGSLINPFGQRADGRRAVAAMYNEYFAGMLKGSSTTATLGTVRPVGADQAFVDAEQTITAPDGSVMLNVHLACLLRRESDDWRFVESRPYVVASPPGLS